jgi:hypothetical protein
VILFCFKDQRRRNISEKVQDTRSSTCSSLFKRVAIVATSSRAVRRSPTSALPLPLKDWLSTRGLESSASAFRGERREMRRGSKTGKSEAVIRPLRGGNKLPLLAPTVPTALVPPVAVPARRPFRIESSNPRSKLNSSGGGAQPLSERMDERAVSGDNIAGLNFGCARSASSSLFGNEVIYRFFYRGTCYSRSQCHSGPWPSS